MQNKGRVILSCFFFKRISSGEIQTGALRYLFNSVVLAVASAGVLVVQYIQGCLSLLQFQRLDFGLQLVQLLLQVLAFLHVLHPGAHKRDLGQCWLAARGGTTLSSRLVGIKKRSRTPNQEL